MNSSIHQKNIQRRKCKTDQCEHLGSPSGFDQDLLLLVLVFALVLVSLA